MVPGTAVNVDPTCAVPVIEAEPMVGATTGTKIDFTAGDPPLPILSRASTAK